MKTVIRHISKVSGILWTCALLWHSFATSVISVDSADFDMGFITEGSMEKVAHIFKVKNTGTGPLKIQQVKPG